MKIKEAIARCIRSRHVGIIKRCLLHEDGLTYDELYAAYCDRCKEEEVRPMARNSFHNTMQYYGYKGVIMIEYLNLGIGTYRIGVRIWLNK